MFLELDILEVAQDRVTFPGLLSVSILNAPWIAYSNTFDTLSQSSDIAKG